MKNSKDAEIALMKERFAEEKKKLLEQMESLSKEKQELQKKNEQLNDVLTGKKKPAEDKNSTDKKSSKEGGLKCLNWM